ncbi:phosphotransferase family protein [Salinigranum sp. GCM10025319]|uniref:phosphotransferase family protein n=1 Tax=Salinigranum sp. GCM10025319 TaxID=3252687 RepID=UPI00360BF905
MTVEFHPFLSQSDILDGDVEIQPQEIPNGSNHYARITHGDSSYFLKLYDWDRQSADWHTHSKHILCKIDQSTPEAWEWFGTEHEYQTLKQVNKRLTESTDPSIIIPSPVELLGDSAILMHCLPDHEVLFGNRGLLWGMHLFHRENRRKRVERTAQALAKLQTHTIQQMSVDLGHYCGSHAELAEDSTLPQYIPEFLREFDYTQLPPLPAVRVHGDFTPRNIIISETHDVGFVDWPLSIVSHPLVDVHEFICHLFRWRTYPGTASSYIQETERAFRSHYLAESEFDIPRESYDLTRLTALIRNYWKFVDKNSGKKKSINQYTFQTAVETEITRIVSNLGGVTT